MRQISDSKMNAYLWATGLKLKYQYHFQDVFLNCFSLIVIVICIIFKMEILNRILEYFADCRQKHEV